MIIDAEFVTFPSSKNTLYIPGLNQFGKLTYRPFDTLTKSVPENEYNSSPNILNKLNFTEKISTGNTFKVIPPPTEGFG
jgi:hypothetical protein